MYLRCTICHSDYSATKGDYWMMPTKHVFSCCGQDLLLVRRSGDSLLADTVIKSEGVTVEDLK